MAGHALPLLQAMAGKYAGYTKWGNVLKNLISREVDYESENSNKFNGHH